jgi:uncharacterized protein YabN with tetrapyrrole methylase and pyrophosphatase domain
MEELIKNDGLKIDSMSLAEMDGFWDKAKKILKQNKKP